MKWWEMCNLNKIELMDEYRDKCDEIRVLEEDIVVLQHTLKQRDKEIQALKHMLDRMEEEKMRFVITNGLPILLEDNDFIIRINLPTPKRAKLPAGWKIVKGCVEHE